MSTVNTDELPVAYVDIETTGLDPTIHEAWEVAVVRTTASGEIEHEAVWQLPVLHPERIDPAARMINGFDSRYHESGAVPRMKFAHDLWDLVAGCRFAGANPAFDVSFIVPILARVEVSVPWHYRLLCVESYAAGVLGWRNPRKLSATAEALGIELDPGTRHTALADALLAYEVHTAALLYQAPLAAG